MHKEHPDCSPDELVKLLRKYMNESRERMNERVKDEMEDFEKCDLRDHTRTSLHFDASGAVEPIGFHGSDAVSKIL